MEILRQYHGFYFAVMSFLWYKARCESFLLITSVYNTYLLPTYYLVPSTKYIPSYYLLPITYTTYLVLMCWERSLPGPPLESPRVSSPSVSHPTSAWASLPSSSPPSLLPSRLPGRTAESRTFVSTSFQAPQSASAEISAKIFERFKYLKYLKYLKYFY